MRAIIVEFARPPDELGSGVIEGVAGVLGPGGSETPPPGRARATKGEGALRPRPAATTHQDEERPPRSASRSEARPIRVMTQTLL